jgi:hypothetical protein
MRYDPTNLIARTRAGAFEEAAALVMADLGLTRDGVVANLRAIAAAERRKPLTGVPINPDTDPEWHEGPL